VIATQADYYPLVLLDLGKVGRSEDDFERMFASFRDVNKKARKARTRHILVAVTHAPLTATERKMVVERSNAFSKNDFALWSGVVLVIQNHVIRGMVTALGWMIPNIPQIESAPTTDLAVPLAAAQLRKQGIDYSLDQERAALEWFRRQRTEGPVSVRGASD
jgi:hypothetical protein